ncbi:DENN domain-containing protein 2D isoform X3 [Pongo pygmaeus]|uniref:DENN domain-containing protein 2D isoform X3 n=1 Tax=Pongo pygmaeus TaxID=9600 RepID=UPI0023E0FE4E|nr:DENN domain-containing protein 2D isoform X3 [Pongo pygmaeus]
MEGQVVGRVFRLFRHRLLQLRAGPPQDNSGEALKEPERVQEHSLPNFAGGQHFFEYLLVVSLKKKRSEDDYEPIITYQFPKILDEVEKRHQISMAVIYPFMQGLREAAFPAPGKTVTLKSFIPDSGTEFISLTRPLDSHLEHVDFSSLLHCLSFEQILQIFASAVLERKIIFLAEGLSTLSQCIHAAAALLYPFSWAHTYIPVVPESLLATVCCPTPFMVGVQMRFQQEVMDSPMEEVLLVNLCEGTFLMSVGDEKDILPPKLQDDILDSLGQGINELKTAEQINEHVSGPFVQFFVKTVGHYASYIKREANGQGHFQERSFCKALTSKTNRRFVKKFVKTQLFSLFIQEAEKSKNPPAGYFQQKILEYEEQKKQKKPREKTVK